MLVLIYDDDIADRPDSYFFPSHLTVHLFDRADDCLNQVATLEPDVVLMDYHMRSSYKGDAAILDLRRCYPASKLPIIGISSAEGLNARLLAAGANRAVPKSRLQDLLFELI